MKSGLAWAKYRERDEDTDPHELSSNYWSSNYHEVTVLSHSVGATGQFH